MIRIPPAYSGKWLYSAGIFFLLTLLQMIVFTVLSSMNLTVENIIGFTILSAVVSAAVAAGGWFDKKIYLYTVLLFYLTAGGYLLYIAVTKKADGWTDLVGIVSYMFVIAAGVTTGIILQFLVFILRKIKKRH